MHINLSACVLEKYAHVHYKAFERARRDEMSSLPVDHHHMGGFHPEV